MDDPRIRAVIRSLLMQAPEKVLDEADIAYVEFFKIMHPTKSVYLEELQYLLRHPTIFEFHYDFTVSLTESVRARLQA